MTNAVISSIQSVPLPSTIAAALASPSSRSGLGGRGLLSIRRGLLRIRCRLCQALLLLGGLSRGRPVATGAGPLPPGPCRSAGGGRGG